MLRIGLTGGIGSGKSTVCELFAEHHVPVIDADIIAHRIVEPLQPGLKGLIDAFGTGILDSEGRLNRRALREQVFQDEARLRQLEAILHPLIRERMHEELSRVHYPYVILAIPLLLEKGWQTEVDRILVVDTDVALQLSRTMQRDNTQRETVEQIIHKQVSRDVRVAAADDIIHNEGDRSELESQVEELHHYYLTLARETG